jgi:hypothetical protein
LKRQGVDRLFAASSPRGLIHPNVLQIGEGPGQSARVTANDAMP